MTTSESTAARLQFLGYQQVPSSDQVRPFACQTCGCLVAEGLAKKHRKRCKPIFTKDESDE